METVFQIYYIKNEEQFSSSRIIRYPNWFASDVLLAAEFFNVYCQSCYTAIEY